MKYNVNAPCPCGSGKKYKKCCQVYHKGVPAPTALHLMKSRYSAFAVGNGNYIISTTHPDHPEGQKDVEVRKRELAHFFKYTLVKDLEILNVEEGEQISYVTFKVSLEQNGQPISFIERSTFEKREGKWLYLDGKTEEEVV
jgi:SEC-C motif-containing protein